MMADMVIVRFRGASRDALEPFVYEWTSSKRGSISAEHGLGLMKAQAVGFSKSAACIAVMKQIKQVLDPRGILNPYKVRTNSTPIRHDGSETHNVYA